MAIAPSHVGELDVVVGAEGGVAELGDSEGGGECDDGGGVERWELGAEGCDATLSEGDGVVVLEEVEGLLEIEECFSLSGGVGDGVGVWSGPPAKRGGRGQWDRTGPRGDFGRTVHGIEALFEAAVMVIFAGWGGEVNGGRGLGGES